MRRALVIAALIVGFAGQPALAADSSAKPAEDSVTLSAMALPLIFDGQVVNYVFVTVKLMLVPGADVMAMHDKEPYFRDALVREAHRTPFVRPNDYNHLDDARLKSEVLRVVNSVMGPGKVRAVVITDETPQHRLASPTQGGGPEIVP